jgi:hypothetical protein
MPASGDEQQLDLLLPKDLVAALDQWRRRQPDRPSRADAATRLLERSLRQDTSDSITPAQLNAENDV